MDKDRKGKKLKGVGRWEVTQQALHGEVEDGGEWEGGGVRAVLQRMEA